jgi:hypothetical protein
MIRYQNGHLERLSRVVENLEDESDGCFRHSTPSTHPLKLLDYEDTLSHEKVCFSLGESLFSLNESAYELVTQLREISVLFQGTLGIETVRKLRSLVGTVSVPSKLDSGDREDDHRGLHPMIRTAVLEHLVFKNMLDGHNTFRTLLSICDDPDDVHALTQIINSRVNLIQTSDSILDIVLKRYCGCVLVPILVMCPLFVRVTGLISNFSGTVDPWRSKEFLRRIILITNGIIDIDFLYSSDDKVRRLKETVLFILLWKKPDELYLHYRFVKSYFGKVEGQDVFEHVFSELLRIAIPS